ncbi:MAG: hypothetical protein ACYCQJ_13200 [Nitrososphaerales archaeon]
MSERLAQLYVARIYDVPLLADDKEVDELITWILKNPIVKVA